MRPSHRAAEDERRIRDRNAKRNVSPGPGTYNPLVTEHGAGLAVDDSTKNTFSTSAKAGKAGFLANSAAHGGDIATDKNNVTIASGWQTPGMGDVNAYNPNHNREMAYKAKQTFQTHGKSGKANFGGTEKRNLLLSNMVTKPPINGWTGPIEDTPGPAAYTFTTDEKGREANMAVMSDGEKMKSSAFASNSAQRGKFALPQAANPGPGTYSPDEKTQVPGIGNLISKTGRDHHFVSDNLDGVGADSTTQAHVGPGSYNSHVHKTIAQEDAIKVGKQSKVAAASSAGQGSLGFGAKYTQRELPHETHHGVASEAEATPGPGQYDPRVTEVGGNLAVDAMSKDTFSTSAKAGKAGFLATSAAHGGDIATDKNNVTIASGWQTPGMGDVNAYNPNHNREMAYDAKQTFQTQSKAGKANFGGTEKRNLLLSNMVTKPPNNGWTGPIEDTPGPAAYTFTTDEKGREANMAVMSDGEKMKSSAFASNSAQRGKFALPQAANPGPGTYSPDEKTQVPGIGNLISKTGRDHHFVSDNLDGVGADSTTQAHVGPGSYNSHVHKTIAQEDAIKVGKQSKVAAASSAGQGSLGFGAKYTQRELPHETHHGVASEAEATPGPGQYDPRVTEVGGNLAVDAMSKDTFSTSAKAGKAGFLATSAAHGGDIATDKNNVTIASGWQTPGMGDVNAYNPNHNREMAYDAKQTFQTQSKAGKANFGGTEKRNLLLSNMVTKPPNNGWTGPIEDTPGPAAYTFTTDEKGREANMAVMSDGEKMKSSAFASNSAQRGKFALPQAANPGPGTYSPDEKTQVPGIGNLISKTGRDHHFVSDNLDGVGADSTTQAHVGPGSYNSHYHNTIQEGQDKLIDYLPHASFMSDTFRTIYTGQDEQ